MCLCVCVFVCVGGRHRKVFIKYINKYFERSLLFQCALNWNALPASDRNIQTSTKFKRKQKCDLNEYFPYTD